MTVYNFNPRSPHGERRRWRILDQLYQGISTHAPRTGSDPINRDKYEEVLHFNPRSPHGERRASARRAPGNSCAFQPTLPARGATIDKIKRLSPKKKFQPTLPARGATRRNYPLLRQQGLFQPTLPARGATRTARATKPSTKHFNPRSPHGERQRGFAVLTEGESISTHAPRTGSDKIQSAE